MGCSTTVSAASFCKNFWPGISGARSKAAKKSFTTAALACGIFARSNISCSAKAISVIYRSFSCCRFVTSIFPQFLPDRWSLTLIFLFVAIPVGELFGTTFAQLRQMVDARICRSGGVHFLLLRPSAAYRNHVRRSKQEFCSGVLWSAPARARDRHEADRAARRGGYSWRSRRRDARVPGNGGGRPACASASSRSCPCPCTTGSTAMSSCR